MSPPKIPYLALSALLNAALIHAAPDQCVPDTFTFPDILGTKHILTTASKVEGYTGFSKWKPESTEIGPEGVSFCNVSVTYSHLGDQDVIHAHVWLPLSGYNNRFVGVGGGGWITGEIGDDAMSALTYKGYATAATDGGYTHDPFSTADAWLMPNPGNVNQTLLTNFANRAVHEAAIIGKHIAKDYYVESPAFSYWSGCSTGGRQGITSALLHPHDFDGILASCPGVEFPSLLLALYWPQFVMNQLGAYPDACQFEALRAAAIEECDKLDGVKDGIISRDDLCRFDPNSVVGKEFVSQGAKCKVSEEAAKILKAMFEGPKDAEGKSLFAGSTPGTAAVGMMALANTLCQDGKCTDGIPFTIATDWIRLLVKKDPSFDSKTLTPEQFSQLFHDSQRDYNGMFGAGDRDFQRFRKANKKMITWHGTSDEAITINAMRRFYDGVTALDKSRGVDTASYYRFFEVPGGTHCSAPVGVAHPLHALDSLRRWVEDGVAPDSLETTLIGQDNEGGKEQNPLCPYPLTGSKKTGKFTCVERKNQVGRDEL
ncbi:hypothetical protein MRS44_009917 [Fusarium solani]|uniref:uncharacterized protein n=1 Tax=Fusarium solani TaxID=169388 RepID=UPI0032C44189|nr:hypothetical protein MRS44_009917 [Fusarium solani]